MAVQTAGQRRHQPPQCLSLPGAPPPPFLVLHSRTDCTAEGGRDEGESAAAASACGGSVPPSFPSLLSWFASATRTNIQIYARNHHHHQKRRKGRGQSVGGRKAWQGREAATTKKCRLTEWGREGRNGPPPLVLIRAILPGPPLLSFPVYWGGFGGISGVLQSLPGGGFGTSKQTAGGHLDRRLHWAALRELPR